MKKSWVLGGILALASMQAVAGGHLGYGINWSGHFRLSSNDVYWGESTTGGRPALAGGLRAQHESTGFYAGVNAVSQMNSGNYMELDVHAGKQTKLTDTVTLDLSLNRKFHPGDSEGNHATVFYGKITHEVYGRRIGFRVSGLSYTELQIDGAYALGMNSYAFGELGYVDYGSSHFHPNDETRYYGGIGLGYTYQALNFKIGYYDSSAKNSDGGEIMASVGVMF